MATISLPHGFSAQVDDQDIGLVSDYNWKAKKLKLSNTYYVYSKKHGGYINGKKIQKSFVLHRMIMGLVTGDRQQVDHINGDGLDNRRCNLRLCNGSQNSTNWKRANKSGFRGVVQIKSTYYAAKIMKDGKHMYLGCFKLPEDAARAYDTAAKELHGKFAVLNFLEVD